MNIALPVATLQAAAKGTHTFAGDINVIGIMISKPNLDMQFEGLQPIPEEQYGITLAKAFHLLKALWRASNGPASNDQTIESEMTIKELSDFLPDHPAVTTLYSWVAEERIPYINHGRRVFFQKSAILEWNRNGRPLNPDNVTEMAQTYVANHPLKPTKRD